MEKLGVEEDPARVALVTEPRLCPWCGGALVSEAETNVAQCPVHGTKPFEPGTVRPLD